MKYCESNNHVFHLNTLPYVKLERSHEANGVRQAKTDHRTARCYGNKKWHDQRLYSILHSRKFLKYDMSNVEIVY